MIPAWILVGTLVTRVPQRATTSCTLKTNRLGYSPNNPALNSMTSFHSAPRLSYSIGFLCKWRDASPKRQIEAAFGCTRGNLTPIRGDIPNRCDRPLLTI